MRKKKNVKFVTKSIEDVESQVTHSVYLNVERACERVCVCAGCCGYVRERIERKKERRVGENVCEGLFP